MLIHVIDWSVMFYLYDRYNVGHGAGQGGESLTEGVDKMLLSL